MNRDDINRYIDRSCNTFVNSVCKLLTENELNKIAKICLKRENNPLNLEIKFIISRQFIPNGTLTTKITATYTWWVGRGFWSADITGYHTQPFDNYQDLMNFVSTHLDSFRTKVIDDIQRSGLRRSFKMLT